MKIVFDKNNEQKIIPLYTQRGDGTVTWDSGIPQGVRVYCMPGISHGDLPKNIAKFGAIQEILERVVKPAHEFL